MIKDVPPWYGQTEDERATLLQHMRRDFLHLITVALLGLASSLYGAVATTPIGASDSDGAVSATANITPGAGTVTVVLTDLLQNPRSSGQTLSGITFTISGASGKASLLSSSGITSSIQSDGSYTPSGSAGSLGHWGAANDANLSTIGIVGSKPYDLIVGPDNKGNLNGTAVGGGKYNNANNGFGNFNPYVLGTATFVLAIPGVTSLSTISGVQFEFGTKPEYVTGVVPEPATLIAGLLLLVPFAASTIRNWRNLRRS